MQPLDIFGSGIKSINPSLSAQRRVNCFYDIRIDSEKSQLILKGTPGTTVFCTLPTFPIRGWIEFDGFLYVLAANVFYQVSSTGGYIKLGTIGVNANTPVSMCINETQLMIVDGKNAYLFPYSELTNVTIPNINSYAVDIAALTTICHATGNS